MELEKRRIKWKAEEAMTMFEAKKGKKKMLAEEGAEEAF